MNNAAAIIATHIIFIKAVVAQRVEVILDGIFLVNPLGTVVADYGQTLRAVLAEPIAFRLIHVFNWVFCTAVCTNFCFAHCLFLHFI